MAGVELSTGKPAVEWRLGVVEHLVPGPRPVDRLGLLGPEALGVVEGTLMEGAISVTDGHGGHSSLSHRLSVAHGPPQSGYVTIRRDALPQACDRQACDRPPHACAFNGRLR